jgi:dihydroxyacetone kinase-like protein
MGIGIHGEPAAPASRSPRPATSPPPRSCHRADMPLSGDLLVMVNGMGGTPLLELYVLSTRYGSTSRHGARIARNLVGNYITSLECRASRSRSASSRTRSRGCGTPR